MKEGKILKTIVAISAGQKKSKKGSSLIRQKQRYLNYGLLGLVTLISQNSDYNIVMFQADSKNPYETLFEIKKSGIDLKNDCECILLSIPSYHSITWCVEICEMIKKEYNLKIIVGGRWVVDNNVLWIKDKLKYVDIVSEGFGENFYSSYFNLKLGSYDGKKHCFDGFDYSLLHNYSDYMPSIEISRGCGAGCHFCADKNNSRLSNKSVDKLLTEIKYLDTIYDEYTPYFEAPHFCFSKNWIDEYSRKIQQRKKPLYWRCTSRIESVPTNMLDTLKQSGLRIIDIGMESASLLQLNRMHKTNDPNSYIKKAEEVISSCYDNDIWVKLNIMLYAGETNDTINETVEWLKRNKKYIKDVSVGSLVYYKNMDNLEELMSYGATLQSIDSLENEGFSYLNLSDDINVEKANEICLQISKLIATQKDFYDIKSFSYYPATYSYENFLSDLDYCDIKQLPFILV